MSPTPPAPTLVFIVGPPAVGKMTVGRELARRTGLRLFTNHDTVDLVMRFFPFGSPPYDRRVGEFRRGIMREVAASGLPGLIFTFVRDFGDAADEATMAEYGAFFTQRGGCVVHAELQAPQAERLLRCATELRLAQKPSMRNVALSRERLMDADRCYAMDSGGRFDPRADWLRMDNTALSPAQAAERIIVRFALPEADGPGTRPEG